MKVLCYGLTVSLLFAIAGLTGCSKKVTVDTVKLDYAFQSADQTNQTTVNEAIEAIEKADYSSATDKLKKVAADPKLSADQKTAVTGVLGQLEKH
jgi:hypothetical protein